MQKNGLDNDGFIISEVDIQNILPEYDNIITDSLAEIKRELPNLVHSAYVYGSVARGNAVRGKSDLDLLLIFTRELTTDERNGLDATLERLSDKYRTAIREVGVADCTLDKMLDPANKFGWGAYLKILCVCVDGEDITERFDRFKLVPEIALGFNGDVGKYIETAIQQIGEAKSSDEAAKLAASLARKLIRSCYSMVMARAQIWTTKLDQQATIFTEYFPEKKDFATTLQAWIAQPPHDTEHVIAVLKSDGKWLTENFAHEAMQLAV